MAVDVVANVKCDVIETNSSGGIAMDMVVVATMI